MSHSLLSQISAPEDLQKFSLEELNELAEEIRTTIIDTLSVNGGHLASNLGIVEATLALHRTFSSPVDKLIFDVSHQCYPHKLLSGRRERFSTLRRFKGISGFTHPLESVHDHFHAGHAGTALSLALGLAKNRDLSQRDEHIIPILGDASLTCGLTLEALNNIPKQLRRFIVILNDNKMSISKSVGAITHILSRFFNNPRSNRIYLEIESFLAKVPGCGETLAKQGHKLKESLKNLVSAAPFFEQFGLAYVGPIDGHDIKKMIDLFESLKECSHPVVVHLVTEKGRGMGAASQNPISYHGVKPFDKITGQFLASSGKATTFPKVFGKHLLAMAENDPSLVTVTPAMAAGSCLEELLQKFPERCLDVGIAEGHAVTLCGGMAYGKKMKIVCSIYATFLQRAFDNLFHDVCLQEAPVLFALDRAGLAGADGTTHNGIYDISFLNAMPNMVICQPRDGQLLKELLESAFLWNRPTAVRYPNLPTNESFKPLQKRELGVGEVLAQGEDIALIALGHMCSLALEVREQLLNHGLRATVIDPIFVKPLDSDLFLKTLSTHRFVATIEEHSLNGGLGMIFNSFVARNQFNSVEVLNFGIPDTFVAHGSHKELLQELSLDSASLTKQILRHFSFKPAPLFSAGKV